MRRLLLIFIAAAALLLQSAASAQARHDCGARSGRTVVGSAAVRVFFLDRGTTRHYRACWRRGGGGKPVELVYGGIDRPDFVNRFLLRGRYLAFVYTSCEPRGPCDSFEVKIVDVERRRVVMATTARSEDYLSGSVRTLVATRGGAAAFLASDGGEQYVRKLDSLGVEELDRGSDVHSLTLNGGRLHWFHGGQERDDHVAHVRRCGPVRHAATLKLSRRLRVYYTESDDTYTTYACLLGGGKPMYLADEEAPPSTAYTYNDFFELRGEHVVWLEVQCVLDFDCQTRIHSADVRRRTTRSGRDFHGIPRVLVNEKGFAAELVQGRGDPADYSILGFDSTGEHVLDEGPGIDPGSIAIFADSVVWRHDGEQRSAPLR